MPVRGPSTTILVVLVCGMLLFGASNSIWSKWQDMQCVLNCSNPDESLHGNFEQPVWQTVTMFLGETLCFLAFSIINSRLNPLRPATRASATAAARKAVVSAEQSRLAAAPLSRPDESAFDFGESAISLRQEERYDPETAGTKDLGRDERDGDGVNFREAKMFWAPAFCDILGTTAMNVGLLWTPVSVYQMLRGALVLWVGVFSVIFLKRKLGKHQWAALATVMVGVSIVGASSLGGSKEVDNLGSEAPGSPILGIVFILGAQVFTATQFVLEERIMEVHSVEPLLAVSYEGSMGLLTMLAAIPFLDHFYGRLPSGEGNLGYFDAMNGLQEIFNNPPVLWSSFAIALSIAFFNYCGLAVTSSLSSTARSTIDTSRTCIIWLISLALGWEQFKWMQVVGFTLLVYGTFIFNGISRFPGWTRFHEREDDPNIATEADADEVSDDEDEDERTTGRSLSVDPTPGRPLAKRAGSGRRGEASPLLKNVVE